MDQNARLKSKQAEASLPYRMLGAAGRGARRLPYFDVQIRGLENVPNEEPYIVGFTHHSSIWDIPLVCHALFEHDGTHLDVMGKRSLMNVAVVGALLRSSGGFSVSQGELDMDALIEANDRLEAGRKIGAALEGGGIKDHELAKISGGIGLLACAANVQTLPVAVAGEVDEYFIAGKRALTVVRNSLIQFGAPLPPAEGSGKFDLEAIKKSITDRHRLDPKDKEVKRVKGERRRLFRMAGNFVDERLQPAVQELYDRTWDEYLELHGRSPVE